MLRLFSGTTPKPTEGTERPLHQLWTELNTEQVLSLDEQKVYVYNNIVKLMNKGEQQCVLPVSKICSVDEVITWLEDVHKVEACVGDLEKDDGTITQYLVVRW